MKKITKKAGRFPLAKLAEAAFKEAVGEVIEEHARLGLPLYVGRGGRAVELPPDQVRKRAAELEAIRLAANGAYETVSSRAAVGTVSRELI